MVTVRAFVSAVLVIAVMVVADRASGQTPAQSEAGVLRSGPTLRARAMTAGALMRRDIVEAPEILNRHAKFERELALAFGFPIDLHSSTDPLRANFFQGMGRWMVVQWSDSRFDEWARSAVLTYSRIEESASFEGRGFDMGVDVDDVARGKFGIRVDRALE